MRTRQLFLIFTLLFIQTFKITLNAQSSINTDYTQTLKVQKNIIKFNYLSCLFRTLNFSYERVVNGNKAFLIGAYFNNTVEEYNDGDNSNESTAFSFTPEYRYYFLEIDKPQGFFLAPYLRYQYFNNKRIFDNYVYLPDGNQQIVLTSTNKIINTYGGGLVIGYQYIFKEKICFDAFLGPSYTKFVGDKKDFDGNAFYQINSVEGIFVRFGSTIGIKF
jgi:Protein of unknown function (DUF3575)